MTEVNIGCTGEHDAHIHQFKLHFQSHHKSCFFIVRLQVEVKKFHRLASSYCVRKCYLSPFFYKQITIEKAQVKFHFSTAICPLVPK